MKKTKRPPRKVRETRARLALHEWFAADRTRTRTGLAHRLGVSQALVSYWLEGTARPSDKLREALVTICGIPTSDWLDAAERVEIQQIRAAV